MPLVVLFFSFSRFCCSNDNRLHTCDLNSFNFHQFSGLRSETNRSNPNFCFYLAGLIEGDGTIFVPKTERSICKFAPKGANNPFPNPLGEGLRNKGKINYPAMGAAHTGQAHAGLPSIQITFDSRDFALALIIQKTLGFGSISKTKGVNAYRLTINNFDGLITLVSILNGKFRTVKINDFYLLCKFLNNRFPHLNLLPLPLNLTPLNTNA
jgi:hypothetical protein